MNMGVEKETHVGLFIVGSNDTFWSSDDTTMNIAARTKKAVILGKKV